MHHDTQRSLGCALTALAGVLFGSTTVLAAPIVLAAPPAGDATYAWNSKYGPYGYDNDELSLGVGLSMGGQYGNDRTVAIFEIPIASLAGQSLTSATLQVDSLGFGTGYFYGSAAIGWLDVGSAPVTGDVVADALGPASTGVPSNWLIYDSGATDVPGIKSLDVASFVQTDLAAGRAYSTFVLSGSRDTYGGIRSAESGFGPQIVAVVPEPSMTGLLALAGLALVRRARA